MLTLQQRIESLSMLGDKLQKHVNEFVQEDSKTQNNLSPFSDVIQRASAANGWFTPDNIIHAFQSLLPWLTREGLQYWASTYQLPEQNLQPKIIGVVMAGNIPMVNFHDFLAVLVSGNRFLGKLSSSDPHLLPYIANELIDVNPNWQSYITFTEGRIEKADAFIATGSNNTSRYFDYYFSRYPHIIRRNRTSVAILAGDETDEQLQALGADVFSYFGLGCRNVSKIYLPHGFPVFRLIEQFQPYANIILHHKYHNNYDYQKAILLINNQSFFDGGFVLLKEDESLHAPVSVINLSFYSTLQQVLSTILRDAENIQCIVSAHPMPPLQTIQPGNTQQPSLTDYPDGVDVMKFLKEL
ncbi:MAG: acyl-CoA reductase [Flavobacteriales bacterium]|nr:acyl-CoA reductase [Flavobacteriales bacterium]